jgi:hypothetical protein
MSRVPTVAFLSDRLRVPSVPGYAGSCGGGLAAGNRESSSRIWFMITLGLVSTRYLRLPALSWALEARHVQTWAQRVAAKPWAARRPAVSSARLGPGQDDQRRPLGRGAVDVKRATTLYAPGQSVRQIAAELGVHWATVSQQLQKAGVAMCRGAPAHPVRTQQSLELRDKNLPWTEVADQVDMSVSGAWSRYRRALPSKPPRLGRWQQVLADGLDNNLATGGNGGQARETKTTASMNAYLLEGGNGDDQAEAVVSRLACGGVAQALCCRIRPAWAKRG